MKTTTFLNLKAIHIIVASSFLAAACVQAGDINTLSEENVITGTMDIQFNTRTQLDNSGKFAAGSSKLGVTDVYNIDMQVAKTTEFSGVIERQPKVKVKLVGVEAQAGVLNYNLDLFVLNPKDLSQKKNVGKWVGSVPTESGGNTFNISGGKKHGSPLRMAVDTVGSAQGFSDNFAGMLIGKQEKGEGWANKLTSFTFERVVGKKKVTIEAKQTDPVQFKNIELAKGPSSIYPHTQVNGRMDYDYDTGNWYIGNVTFKYNVNGKEYQDVMSGSIKWVEGEDRPQTGIGYYDFNLRFNEDQYADSSSESDAFDNLSEEEAFFMVDNSIPALTGKAEFVDTFIPGSELTPSASKVTYHLNANKLSKQQIINFFKLWLLAIGPVNDE